MNLTQCFVLILVLFTLQARAFPVDKSVTNEIKPPSIQVLDFLKKYGYLKETDNVAGSLYSEDGLQDNIKQLQRFGAIKETGRFDNATLKLIASPRCGVKDINPSSRSKRYILSSKGWNKRLITYFIANWTPKLGRESVSKNIKEALDVWANHASLKFIEVDNADADIIISFGRGYHGDYQPFDGPGYVLAHAFSPTNYGGLDGDVHFDEDEAWTDLRNGNAEKGTDFLSVALHELGHSLGLSHTYDKDAIMFPYYQIIDPTAPISLGYDDILGMYELYIQRYIEDENYDRYMASIKREPTTKVTESSTQTSTTKIKKITTSAPPTSTAVTRFTKRTTALPTGTVKTTTTGKCDTESVEIHKTHEKSPIERFCEGTFDAVANLRQEIFMFKGEFLLRLKDLGRIVQGYPVPFRQMFPDLPPQIKQIDAAYERPDGMIVLFTGNQFWVYDGRRFVENSPRPLTDYGLPSALERIDAVQIWAKNGKTYFYLGDQFWRYNETDKLMEQGYPKSMSKWRGVPYNIDAAITWKGSTYFFMDNVYWKFDNNRVHVDRELPLPASQIWLNCR